MTAEEAYADAHWPPAVRVFGRRLAPITLGHLLLLRHVRSPFPMGEGRRVPGLGDALLAAWILSQPWRRAARRLNGRAMRLWIGWVAFWWQAKPPDLAARDAALRAGLLNGALRRALALDLASEVWRDSQAPVATAPWLMSLKLHLMERGRTEAEAMDTPPGVAIWECCGLADRRGQMRFATEAEKAAKARIVERELATAAAAAGAERAAAERN